MQFCMAGNESEGLRYGTLLTGEKFYMEWKDDGFKEHQEERDPVDVRISEKCETIDNKLLKQIYAMFDKERFVDLIMNFVVFDKGIKKVCRYNQYFGIKRTEQRLSNLRTEIHNPNRDQDKPLGGILWHTQGSGKTLTMVWLAKWILTHWEELNARVLIVTDRDELDEQIEKTFTGVDENIVRTKSGKDLLNRLNVYDDSLICSLVHKFAADAEKIGDFDDLTLLDFVAKQGETLTGEGDSGHKEGAAEAIENNIRKKVSWTWDDGRIRGILASLSQGYPMGAIMRLECGNENVKFKYRPIEGVKNVTVAPDHLILDGQQRLTSMYRTTCSTDAVLTKTDKGKEIKRFYYLDMKKCLDDNEDRYDAIVPVPEDRKVKTDFDRKVLLDLSTKELEYENEMFPINIIFDGSAREDWADGYKEYHEYGKDFMERYKQFRTEVIETITGYKLPVITLGRETPREAVCKVFENVNTGGVALTVFELVTATFATYEFDLRKDWEECRDVIWGKNEPLNTDVMKGVDETAFLTTITLYTSFFADTATTCKKKDVLGLEFESYQANKAAVLEGYKMARKFLFSQYVFRMRDLPYTTQLIPLAAICAVIGKSSFNLPQTQKILARWFWCGIMGEMYGGANETRFANDIEDVVAAIQGSD